MQKPTLQIPNGERMIQMITGYWVTQTVHAAAAFSLADHLAKAPATAADIAHAEGIAETPPFASFGVALRLDC